MFRYFTYAFLAIAPLALVSLTEARAQDREGRIETTTDRIESRRRLQQYKDEALPPKDTQVAPFQNLVVPQKRIPRAVTRAPASIMLLSADPASRSAVSKRRAVQAPARVAPITVVPSAPARRSLPRD